MSIVHVHGQAACGTDINGWICFWWQRMGGWLWLAFFFMREFLLEDLAAWGFDLKKAPGGGWGDPLDETAHRGIP